jgi:hypothetical protein
MFELHGTIIPKKNPLALTRGLKLIIMKKALSSSWATAATITATVISAAAHGR